MCKPHNSMCAVTQLKILNSKTSNIWLSLIPYLRNYGFLSLLYVMGLVTVVSIQLGPTHPSSTILQLMLSILKIVHWISKIIFWCLKKNCQCVSMVAYILYLPSLTHNCTYIPCSLYTCPECSDTTHNRKSMGPRLSISNAYTTPLQMQSHGFIMTLVSIKQLRVTPWQKLSRTQEAVRDKIGWQSQQA